MGKRAGHQQSATIAAIATVALGWLLAVPHDSPGLLARWSYDFLQLIQPGRTYPDTVIIFLDEQASRDYGMHLRETAGRSVHARLIDRLTKQHNPKVIVLDIMLLSEGRDAAADAELAAALRRNQRVVLAADKVRISGLPKSETDVPPRPEFATNAAAWGVPKVWADSDGVVRRYGLIRLHPNDDQARDLAWAAAQVAGAASNDLRQPLPADQRRWLNGYWSAFQMQSSSISYSNAESQLPGFFDGKAVIIGGKPDTVPLGQSADVFRTPFGGNIPGVYLTALAYANLVHGETLTRPSLLAEFAALLIVGWMTAFGLSLVSLRHGIWLSLGFAACAGGVAIVFCVFQQIWFPWMIVALAQVPCALAFRLLGERRAWPQGSSEAEVLHEIPTTLNGPTTKGEPGRLDIPDHTLIRCIGEGSYGQVWVARNAIGLYHAVKVVYQSRFGTDGPYERALRGIQKFMPVSRSHAGFVHILHVGRNEATGYFFYIMEAGDDEKTGQQIDPVTYIPKTLASELRRWERLPGRQCLEFSIAIAEAVEQLHQHQLIHRDIKPANIIFVGGRPKLADIDLVTDISPAGEASRIGTEGYMAPEGPGSAAADVFSLGRVLYVALTGKAPDQSPELPTRISTQPDCDLVLELNRISCKACELEPARRYASAALMRADLMEVAARLGASPGQSLSAN